VKCSLCEEDKQEEAFSKQKNTRGRCYWCKVCMRKKNKQWMQENKEKRYEYSKDRREKNLEKFKAAKRKWDTENFEHRRAYRQANAAYYKERNMYRRARALNATPSWLTPDMKASIKELYWLADDLKRVSGQIYHVDHVVPLCGKTVCGLHVPWNLQILPEDINVAKNRHFDGWG